MIGRKLSVAALLLGGLWLSTPSHSATWLHVPAADFVAKAELIVTAYITKKQYGEIDNRTYTFYSVRIDETIKGTTKGPTLVFPVHCGTMKDGSRLKNTASPTFEIGEKHLLFIAEPGLRGAPYIMSAPYVLRFTLDPATGTEILTMSMRSQVVGIENGEWISIPRSDLRSPPVYQDRKVGNQKSMVISTSPGVTVTPAPTAEEIRLQMEEQYRERIQQGSRRPIEDIRQIVQERASDLSFQPGVLVESVDTTGVELRDAD